MGEIVGKHSLNFVCVYKSKSGWRFFGFLFELLVKIFFCQVGAGRGVSRLLEYSSSYFRGSFF